MNIIQIQYYSDIFFFLRFCLDSGVRGIDLLLLGFAPN